MGLQILCIGANAFYTQTTIFAKVFHLMCSHEQLFTLFQNEEEMKGKKTDIVLEEC